MPDLGLNVLLKGKNMARLLGGLWVALRISLLSVAISIPLGILLGVLAAVKRGTKWDTGSMFIALLGVSMPSFIIGALLQYGLGLQLPKLLGFKLFPITGWNGEMSKLIPAFALGFSTLAVVSPAVTAVPSTVTG